MKFTIMERLLLYGQLPEKADYNTLKDIKEFSAGLGFNEEEIRKYDIKDMLDPQGRHATQFNIEVAAGYEKEIKIGKYAVNYFVNKFKEMDKEKQLDAKLLTLYEKFCL